MSIETGMGCKILGGRLNGTSSPAAGITLVIHEKVRVASSRPSINKGCAERRYHAGPIRILLPLSPVKGELEYPG